MISLLALWSCTAEPPVEPTEPHETLEEAIDRQGLSPTARPDMHKDLQDARQAVRRPSDGGGRAWLLSAPQQPVAGQPGTWEIAYEAGPLGVARGGAVFLIAPPFWYWSTPQVTDPGGLGFTQVSTTAEGVALTPTTVQQGTLAVWIEGRGLEPGEQLRFVYGAGPAGALADRYAEHDSMLWVAVDGDGDGVRGLVKGSPTVDVVAGPARHVELVLPSSARPGEAVRLSLAAMDGWGNAGTVMEGEISLAVTEGQATLSTDRLVLGPRADGLDGTAVVQLSPTADGVVRVTATLADGATMESNPLLVGDGPRWVWADLHGHSQLSDGSGTADDYYAYARDVAALDISSLTDHDHWGLEPMGDHPELFELVRQGTERNYQPGRFVTLLGYEWTSWLQGHRHVLWFSSDDPERQRVYDSVDPDYSTPQQLWAALQGQDAMTLAHHSAGGPVATNWDVPPDPVLEPLTEVMSVHGSSEAMDSPTVIYDPVPGNFARDALDRGYKLGFVGSGDTHDGHPGMAHLGTGIGGVAAVQVEELTREAVLEALRDRRTYATSGVRIVLRASLSGRRMGSTLAAADVGEGAFQVQVVAPGPLDRVDVVRSGAVAGTLDCRHERVCVFEAQLKELHAGEYVYVRAVQDDGAAAWSSPWWVE